MEYRRVWDSPTGWWFPDGTPAKPRCCEDCQNRLGLRRKRPVRVADRSEGSRLEGWGQWAFVLTCVVAYFFVVLPLLLEWLR
jgi:hypothetical protein